jgi:hypothetical protein
MTRSQTPDGTATVLDRIKEPNNPAPNSFEITLQYTNYLRELPEGLVQERVRCPACDTRTQ